MVRKQGIQSIGGFDPSRALMSLEDWDLWYRLAQQHCFAYLDTSVAKYRLVENSLSRNPQTLKTAAELLEQKIEHSPAFPAFAEHARANFYFYWGVLWLEYGKPDVALDRFRTAIQISPRNVLCPFSVLVD